MCKMPEVIIMLDAKGDIEKELGLKKLAIIQWKYECF